MLMADDSRKDGQITSRLVSGGVAEVLVEEGITQRLKNEVPPVTEVLTKSTFGPDEIYRTTKMVEGEELSDEQRVMSLRKGDLIADRYEVAEGPIGGYSGEAQVFRCRDRTLDIDVVVKYYKPDLFPKEDVLRQLRDLSHPDIVRLLDYDTWGGRFFEVLEYCAGGSVIDFAPFSEAEIKEFLFEITNGLNACHALGIIHRDIKPNNLFFRRPGKRDLVIGDFGVSSVFKAGANVWTTKTYKSRTLHYAAPELLDQRQIGPKTDYYALGITLIHLLTGRSPFDGFHDEAVFAAHFRSQIPLPQNASPELIQLFKGLLRRNTERRWGYNQVMAWAQGEPVLADDGSPDFDDPFAGKEHPYSRVPEADTPAKLALYLDRFNAREDLFKGKISAWVFLFDASLGDRVDEIVDNYTREKELGVFKLRYVLDPTIPLDVAGNHIYTIDQVLDLLRSPDDQIQSALESLLWDKRLECWIETVNNGETSLELSKEIGGLRERLPTQYRLLPDSQRRSLGILSLHWLLDPGFPLQLADGMEITRPDELEKFSSDIPRFMEAVQRVLYGGWIEEWMSQCFPDRVEDRSFITRIRDKYPHDKELGAYALRWRFSARLPFPFHPAEQASDPVQLASLIDRSEEDWQRGIEHLSKGWIREWLVATGRLADPSQFDQLVGNRSISWNRIMEGAQHILDPALPWPQIAADVQAVDFGRIRMGSTKSHTIVFRNAGRGFIAGNFNLRGDGRGITIDQQSFEGGTATVVVSAKPLGLPERSTQRLILVAQANGSTIEIPVFFTPGITTARIAGVIIAIFVMAALVGGVIVLHQKQINWERQVNFVGEFCGTWEYSQYGSKNYLKIDRYDSTILKLISGYKYKGRIIWCPAEIANTDGIYLRSSNGQMKAEFVSSNFYPTHGDMCTYRITLDVLSINRILYTVYCSVRGGETDKLVATKVNN